MTQLKSILDKYKDEENLLCIEKEDALLKDNFVLNRYSREEGELNVDSLFKAADSIFDLQN